MKTDQSELEAEQPRVKTPVPANASPNTSCVPQTLGSLHPYHTTLTLKQIRLVEDGAALIGVRTPALTATVRIVGRKLRGSPRSPIAQVGVHREDEVVAGVVRDPVLGEKLGLEQQRGSNVPEKGDNKVTIQQV